MKLILLIKKGFSIFYMQDLSYLRILMKYSLMIFTSLILIIISYLFIEKLHISLKYKNKKKTRNNKNSIDIAFFHPSWFIFINKQKVIINK